MGGRILFLDRDGTLNRAHERRPPNRPDEVELLPGVSSVLSAYAAQGWVFVIVSNQGGVASGYITEAEARAIQDRVIELLPVPVATSYLCPHMAGGRVAEYAVDCPNRKPRPGFILAALEKLGARAEEALFVGDSSTDREAAEAAGVPFRWADLFFGRRIDRGFRLAEGPWVQVHQADPHEWTVLAERAAAWSVTVPDTSAVDGVDNLCLVALHGEARVGWLTLIRAESTSEAALAFGVAPAFQMTPLQVDDVAPGGVGPLLLETALDWASARAGLTRLCVDVPADNLPVSRLCCRYGFEESGRARGWIRLDCWV
jgi:D-glycero-D-manno-heptose 1,7-bisphosphate phosphatase